MVESTNPENNAQDKEALEKNLIDQERFLPIANINRIMKQALPSDTKISNVRFPWCLPPVWFFGTPPIMEAKHYRKGARWKHLWKKYINFKTSGLPQLVMTCKQI